MKVTYVTFDLITINGNEIIQNLNHATSKKAGMNYVYNSISNTEEVSMCMTEKEYQAFKNNLNK